MLNLSVYHTADYEKFVFLHRKFDKANNFIMKRLPIKFKTSLEESILILESRSDKLGNLFYTVSFKNNGTDDYVCFSHLSSALDFIQTNFK